MKTPQAPDPMQTAQAQSGMNRDAAVSSQLVNMTDQSNPWGSVSYQQNGTNSYTDSSGKVVTVPKFTQTTSYTPGQQQIFDSTQTAQQNIAQTAADQSAWMQDYLADPFKFDNQDAADWSYDLASSRILPQQQEAQRTLEARLVNQGIRPGTQAWDSEMSRMTNANTDQMNQLALNGRGQAFNEAAYTRSSPLNEIAALLSGSQIANPGAQSPGTPQTQVAGVDYTGLVNQNYQSQLQNSNAMMGGLFGLAGKAASFIPGFGG